MIGFITVTQCLEARNFQTTETKTCAKNLYRQKITVFVVNARLLCFDCFVDWRFLLVT